MTSINDGVRTDLDAFIDRWDGSGGAERANYALFLTELCDVLDLPKPDPAGGAPKTDAYVFERASGIPPSGRQP